MISAGFFILGLVIFGSLVLSFGIGKILDNLASAGPGLALAVLIWLAIYLLNTLSWKLALGPAGDATSFGKLFMITVTGFIINYITPVVALGGESYKVQALSGGMGSPGAVSAVVLYRMVHLLGHMLLLLAGIAVAFFVVMLNPPMAVALGLAGLVILAVIGLTLKGAREGVFDRIAAVVGKYRILTFLARPVGAYREELAAMDRVLTGVARNDRRAFLLSILLEFISRVLMGVEVWIVLGALGAGVSPLQAIFVYVTYSIAINLFFFIPMNVGARE
ncbi:MAG TPA: flippase-like domain-containing protein, partial [Bacteroidota bacterium]|nr:flippase-like domain-containing protein [Bacteroidota bacterium]